MHAMLTAVQNKPASHSDLNANVTSPILDLSVLAELKIALGEDDPSFLIEIIQDYLQDAPTLRHEMGLALASQDVTLFKRSAHTLKSISGTMGAQTVSLLCEQLEELGRNGDLITAAPIISQLDQELARAQEALQAEIKASVPKCV